MGKKLFDENGQLVTEGPNLVAMALNEIRKEIAYLKKDGNTGQYNFLSEARLTEVIRPMAIDKGLVMIPCGAGPPQMEYRLGSNGNMHMTTWVQRYKLIHVESGDEEEIAIVAQGMDPGDKGAYKGNTASHKYAWLRALMLETGDDPEADRSTDDPGGRPQGQQAPTRDEPQVQDQGTTAEQDEIPEDAELLTWLEQVDPEHELTKDDKKRWDIWKTVFAAAEKKYGKNTENYKLNKMEPMDAFDGHAGINRQNPMCARDILPFRAFIKDRYYF